MKDTDINVKRKYFKVADLLVAFVVLSVAVASVCVGFLKQSKADSLVAVVRVDGKVYSEVDLSEISEPYEVPVPTHNGEVVVRFLNDGAQVVSSPCSDKLCVNTGKLTKTGQSAVCLPERVSVQIVSGNDTEPSVDSVAG